MRIFDSGIVEVYQVANVGDGNMPNTTGVQIFRSYFADVTVGYGRYYTAKAENDRIDRLIQCNDNKEVSTSCYAIIGTKRYIIRQVQHIIDDGLPAMQLSLEHDDNYIAIPEEVNSNDTNGQTESNP